MNILVAGIHAVGKSFLCAPFAEMRGWKHRSASQLIKEELGSANWSENKQVNDADTNQRALVAAVRRANANGDQLLLDGHFVLRGRNDELIPLGPDVFADLNLNGVVLLEARPELILERLLTRDGVNRELADIAAFLDAERIQAKRVCSTLSCPLIELTEPALEDFIVELDNLSSSKHS